MKLLLLFIISISCYAGIEDQYRKLPFKIGSSAPKNIDYVYIINLDQRTDRLERCQQLLLPYGIIPERFPAIYGWALTPERLSEVGLKFEKGMREGHEYVMVFPPEKKGDPDFVWLDPSWYGKACFSGWTVKGTIGCSLSHFSVLKDGYDSGYKTIWILEDDIEIVDDPNKLGDLVAELNEIVGPDGWDMLYTDFDYLIVDRTKDLFSQIGLIWRPDISYVDLEALTSIEYVGDHFAKIGGRSRAHSIIYSRAGMAKITKFYREHHNFLPYDQEIPLIPDIQIYVVRNPIVTVKETYSDTRYRHFRDGETMK